MHLKQTTLRQPITFRGKGLHTGATVTMTVLPAPADRGIVFRRVDLPDKPEIPALATYVTSTARGTTISISKRAKVSTIEHLISALWTLGVDNAVVEIDGPETPIMDGSAREYTEAILRVGVEELEAECRYFAPTEAVTFAIPDKGVEIVVEPADDFSVEVTVDYASQVVGRQRATYSDGDDYQGQIASCRTFVFLHEILPLLMVGLIKGGDVENAIVVVEKPISWLAKRVICRTFHKEDISLKKGYMTTLRYDNEIARHKLLDILGDLALLGVRIRGHVRALRPGHRANTQTALLLHQKMCGGVANNNNK